MLACGMTSVALSALAIQHAAVRASAVTVVIGHCRVYNFTLIAARQ